jgi:hypothetical protein
MLSSKEVGTTVEKENININITVSIKISSIKEMAQNFLSPTSTCIIAMQNDFKGLLNGHLDSP